MILPLFSIPVYAVDFNIDKNIKTYLNNIPTVLNNDSHCYISKDTNLLNNRNFKQLNKELIKHINIYKSNVLEIKDQIKLYITDSWLLKHKQNNYGPMHNHFNSLISGVLYIKVPENSGNITFYKSGSFGYEPSIALDYKNYNFHNSSSWTLNVKENSLILFPSNLMHSISPNLSNKTRLSLAFNVFLKGDLSLGGLSKLKI